MDRLEELKGKYQAALAAIQQEGVRLTHLHVQDNKLFIQGAAPSEQVKNDVWNKIKSADASYSDLTCDLSVDPSLAPAQAQVVPRTHKVQVGETLSKIAKDVYGNANEYNKIFEANRDKLKNPDQIQVGQELLIPA